MLQTSSNWRKLTEWGSRALQVGVSLVSQKMCKTMTIWQSMSMTITPIWNFSVVCCTPANHNVNGLLTYRAIIPDMAFCFVLFCFFQGITYPTLKISLFWSKRINVFDFWKRISWSVLPSVLRFPSRHLLWIYVRIRGLLYRIFVLTRHLICIAGSCSVIYSVIYSVMWS